MDNVHLKKEEEDFRWNSMLEAMHSFFPSYWDFDISIYYALRE